MIISQQCGIKAKNISRDTDLIKDLELSSLDIVSCVVACEDTWDITIPDDDIRKFRYVKILWHI